MQNHSHEYGTAFHSENCIWDCSGWTKSMKSGNHLIFFLLNLMHIGCQWKLENITNNYIVLPSLTGSATFPSRYDLMTLLHCILSSSVSLAFIMSILNLTSSCVIIKTKIIKCSAKLVKQINAYVLLIQGSYSDQKVQIMSLLIWFFH